MSYAALFALLEPVVAAAQGGLWIRQMVLGPTPEFCLQSTGPALLPSPIEALNLLAKWQQRLGGSPGPGDVHGRSQPAPRAGE